MEVSEMKQSSMLIGEVAKRVGVNIRTLHYYESRGLIPKPARSASNYRLYSDDTERRVRFIKRAQELGFSLKEIKELLALRVDAHATCADVRERTRAKIASIEEKITALRAMKKALVTLSTTCSGRGPVRNCSILDGFERAKR
jgi:Cu(I)-responsive transcriptional regulator